MKQNPGHNLVALFNRGNEKAFYTLYKQLYPSIFTMANKMVANTQEAQDICTESFVKLFQTEEKFESIQNLKAFLFRITRNACLDALKKEERHSLRHKELLYLMENKENIFRQEVEAELMELLYASIENLPKKCRNVFKLTLIGLTYEEIAAHLNISESTVRNQKARGLKLLRMALLRESEFSKNAVIISLLLTLVLKKNHL
jgi:RNA polymerase sigma-70 factor (family 1)